MSESVLLVPFPELADVVEPWLERVCPTKPSHGVPPHVTLLFPFPPPDDEVVAGTAEVLAAREAVLLSEVAPRRWEPRARFPFREA